MRNLSFFCSFVFSLGFFFEKRIKRCAKAKNMIIFLIFLEE